MGVERRESERPFDAGSRIKVWIGDGAACCWGKGDMAGEGSGEAGEGVRWTRVAGLAAKTPGNDVDAGDVGGGRICDRYGEGKGDGWSVFREWLKWARGRAPMGEAEGEGGGPNVWDQDV